MGAERPLRREPEQARPAAKTNLGSSGARCVPMGERGCPFRSGRCASVGGGAGKRRLPLIDRAEGFIRSWGVGVGVTWSVASDHGGGGGWAGRGGGEQSPIPLVDLAGGRAVSSAGAWPAAGVGEKGADARNELQRSLNRLHYVILDKRATERPEMLLAARWISRRENEVKALGRNFFLVGSDWTVPAPSSSVGGCEWPTITLVMTFSP